jgi:type II secretory pathway pseudopilin PulG
MRHKWGFTLLELVIVMMVGLALMSIAVRGVGSMRSRASVQQARQAYVALHARARAQAVEFGQRTLLRIDPEGDSIWVSRNDTVLAVVRFGSEMGVDVQSGGAAHTVCMNARGFADPSCNSFTSPLTIVFIQQADTSRVSVLPLGQVVY